MKNQSGFSPAFVLTCYAALLLNVFMLSSFGYKRSILQPIIPNML